MHFKYLVTGICILFAGFLSDNFYLVKPHYENIQPFMGAADTEYTITGVGDMMYGTDFPSSKYLPRADDPFALIAGVADTISSTDILTGNLEGSFLNGGSPFKKCRDTTLCYLFRMPERYIYVLKKASFDFLCLANNHFGDFGWPAVSRTTSLLDSLGIKYAGPVEHKYAIVEKDSVRFGFCAFSTTAGAVDMNDSALCGSVVRELSAICDIVIVSFHGGAEGEDFQHVTRQHEIFHGEDRGDVYGFAHHMIDCGADVVFGHGPHVSRAIEIYKERLICYSLGNFCTYGRFNILGPNGIAPVVRAKVDKKGKFLSGRIIPMMQGQDGIVRMDPEKRAIRKIKELTSADFPEAKYSVTDDGQILNN